jgi:hypothetical protein
MANHRFVIIVAGQDGLRRSTLWQKSQGTARESKQGLGETYDSTPSDPQTEDPRVGLKRLEIANETNL